MDLDIERLHNVIEGEPWGINTRQLGQTTAMLVRALQSAHVMSYNHTGTIAVIGGFRSKGWMMNLFLDLAEEFDIKVVTNPNGSFTVVGDDDGAVFPVEVIFLDRVEIMPRLRGKRLMNYYVDHYIAYQLVPEEINFLESRIVKDK